MLHSSSSIIRDLASYPVILPHSTYKDEDGGEDRLFSSSESMTKTLCVLLLMK